MNQGFVRHPTLLLALVFAPSCGMNSSVKNGKATEPRPIKGDLLTEAEAAKISLSKNNPFNAEEPIGNPATAFTGRFGPQFNWPIITAHAALMPNGKVFNYGTDGQGNQGANFNYDVWNPALGTESNSHQWLVNQTATDIFCGATSLLPDSGDVLVAGGDTRNPANNGISSSFIFRQTPQSLDRMPYMQFARWYPSAITLPNGETFVHGGTDGSRVPVNTPEIFSNGQWRTLWGATNEDITADEEGRWYYPRNWVAPNGRVFGMSGNRMYFLDWQDQGGSEVVGYLPNKTRSYSSTAVMYQPGKILQVGGSTLGDVGAEGSNQAITVDITSGHPVVQDLPNMAKRRVWANSTVLPNGEVLITGGSAFDNKLVDTAQVAEIWNPNTRQFRQVATARSPRLYHSISLLLPDATLLVSGGGAPGPIQNLNGEIFYPPYLFDSNGNFAQRLSIGNMGDKFGYNHNVSVPYYGGGQVKRVTLVRNGAVTHSFDVGQRFLELPFTVQNGAVEVIMPNSPNIAPPGYYMLFLINEAGVPSVGKILNLGGQGVTAPQPESPGIAAGDIVQVRAQFSNKCLDVAGQGFENGVSIQQYECNNSGAQSFRVVQNQNGTFSLANVSSNKCLDLVGLSLDNGGLVQQWDCSGGQNQTLNFKPQADGSYEIRFGHSKKCMDVPGASFNNGVRIQQWDCSGAGNQKWNLIK
jgi:hypothetical protein